MKKNMLKRKLIVLFVCCIVILVGCSVEKNEEKQDVTANFVVTDVLITETPSPTKIQTKDKQNENEVLLETLSSNETSEEKEGATSEYEKQEDGKNEEEETKEVISDTTKDEVIEALERVGSILTPDASEIVDSLVVNNIKEMPAESIVKIYETNAATLAACFYAEEIQPSTYMRMENKSFGEECTTPIENLRYVRLLHFGFDGQIHIGELVVNQMIAKDIVDIFKELFDERYPIERVVLVDNYDADDNESMQVNNTSSFNYRVVEGTSKLSNHAYGLAIDINPLYNPYVRTIEGKEVVLPENALEYVDRSFDNAYYIQKGDVCYNAFIKRGFTWGGNWETSKDYQHFQKVFE